MSNLYTTLRRLLPEAPVLIGRVVEHHPEDDSSTIELPSELPTQQIDANLAVGSQFRARGRSVAVGRRAFVRNGVVESEAPEGEVLQIEVGREVSYAPLAWVGPPLVPALQVGVPATVDLAAQWTGGATPLRYTVKAGALPAGLTLDAFTGKVQGTPTVSGVAAGLVFRLTDASAEVADAPPVAWVVAP